MSSSSIRPATPLPRREFLRRAAIAGAAALVAPSALAALPKAAITRVRFYRPPNLNQHFNQSDMVVTVETDAGLTGIGEGGARDTLTQCAERLIGRNPFDIERCWQDMYHAWFYPPGREKAHALGALDLALWDLKGKALGVPVRDLIGGAARDHFECYATGMPRTGTLRDRARAAIDAGFRAFRLNAADAPAGTSTFDARAAVRQLAREAREVREGVGPDGDWIVDFHQRFDFGDALRGCRAIEEFAPLFVEDPVRMEAFLDDIPRLRAMTIAPLAAGEQWGVRWEFHRLIAQGAIDWMRGTLPNVGGITELLKIAALCETHTIGLAPHFTGPIATAALVQALAPFPGPVLLEWFVSAPPPPHLPEWLDFRAGRIVPNGRPGLGVTLDLNPLTLVGEVTTRGPDRPLYYRRDGSQTNW